MQEGLRRSKVFLPSLKLCSKQTAILLKSCILFEAQLELMPCLFIFSRWWFACHQNKHFLKSFLYNITRGMGAMCVPMPDPRGATGSSCPGQPWSLSCIVPHWILGMCMVVLLLQCLSAVAKCSPQNFLCWKGSASSVTLYRFLAPSPIWGRTLKSLGATT